MLGARNKLPTTVKSVKVGNVMAEVVMSVGDVELVAAITRGSAEQLGLKAGDSVKAVIKATEVLLDKSWKASDRGAGSADRGAQAATSAGSAGSLTASA
jgi:molybdopterin-binding protein